MTTERYELWKLTPYEKWVHDEGISVLTQQMVDDIQTVELQPWERTGCNAALLDLTDDPVEGSIINSPGTIRYLCDIPPGGTFNAEKHMYEEIFYVVKGQGATTVWNEGGPKHTFEWKEGSVFSIPLNAWHEIYNGQGYETARLYAATNAPTAFNLYASPELVFDCPMVFPERFNAEDPRYFSGEERKLEDRFAETNFIADVRGVPRLRVPPRHLQEGPHRGVPANLRRPGLRCRIPLPQRRRLRRPVAGGRAARPRRAPRAHRLSRGLSRVPGLRLPSALQPEPGASALPGPALREPTLHWRPRRSVPQHRRHTDRV